MSVVDIVHISIMRHSYTGCVSTASLYMQEGRTERSNRLPAHRLFDDSVDVRQLVAHVEVGKAVASNNRNDLCLRFLLHSGVAQHREEEGLDGGDGLTNKGERQLFVACDEREGRAYRVSTSGIRNARRVPREALLLRACGLISDIFK